MGNETDILNRILSNTLAMVAVIIGGLAYLVYRFLPTKKKSTGEHSNVKPSDLIDVIQQLSKSQAMMSELLAKHPDLFVYTGCDDTN